LPSAIHVVFDEANFWGADCQPAAPFFDQQFSLSHAFHGVDAKLGIFLADVVL
jgi:hypothetical protein